MILPPVRPIPLKERLTLIFLEKGELDVIDGAFVLVDVNGIRTQIPVGGVACLMLEPGTRVSHAAVVLAARVGCLLVWVGEAGVRLYSSGRPGGARSDRLLYQAQLALDEDARLRVVRKMYEVRFGEEVPASYSVNQLRGMEGARVRRMYENLAKRYRVRWNRREYDATDWGSGDVPNRCLSSATACLYGICEAAVLASGYSAAIGFIHTGKPLSFVYDIADLVKFETVVPAAFATAARHPVDPERETRLACRDAFRSSRLLERVIPLIDEVLAAGGLSIPEAPSDALPPAIPEEDPWEP
ncbi:type I-E CRISPR-associated endonuclease Cas1e [uncultured Methanofollis sp.]|uniref:type I-E CRISPR-associated endonuclease Cas1e n=1 Tax=uncultured Methanofollis sp. TaxID=262500 RepID=UPI00261E3032|nr:type I-E CRISPR-associated endonuclease Cas1e [uncultured Methanofollis sp.]